ncbi:uncharacterized protein LOC143363848 [Halictus rubicundus]|uniref:uncharacterized protein LOC143363746 n=1 Tax=Halictus rubicundus TaxID=77578 RepID=UPI004035A08E
MAESASFAMSRIEPLTSKNYALWSMRLAALIKAKHLYQEVIVQDEPIKDENDAESVARWNDWSRKNGEVCAIIILTLSAEQAMACRNITMAKELWNTIKRRHEGAERQRKTQLKMKLARIEKLEKESIDEYFTRVQSLATEISELGTVIDEGELIYFIIEGLPNKYSEVTTAISSNPNITYETTRETLLRFESKYDKMRNEIEAKAFKVIEQKKGSCYNCGKYGHLARDCRSRPRIQSERGNNTSTERGYRGQHSNNKGNRYGYQGKNNYKSYKDKRTYEHRDEYAMRVRENLDINANILGNGEKTVWMLDSACTSDMSFQSNIISNQRPENTEITTAEHGRSITDESRDLNCNLMSVPSLVKRGKRIILDEYGAEVYEKKTDVEVEKSQRILERLHVDLCGPMPKTSLGGSKYMLWLLKNTALTYMPQSNGLAERANRFLIDMARTLLIDASLPQEFWAEAVWTASYIHNVVPTKRRIIVPLEI